MWASPAKDYIHAIHFLEIFAKQRAVIDRAYSCGESSEL